MRTSIAPTEAEAGPARSSASHDTGSGGPDSYEPDSYEEEIEALKRSLREQRRATTLLTAEARTQTEAREALEAQLIEANAEISATRERRKEMTRVIADREARLAEAHAELEARRAEAQAELEASRAMAEELESSRKELDELRFEIVGLRSEIRANRERRKEIAQVVANRDAKIVKLKAEMQARYEDLAALQRHIARSSMTGRAKRLLRPFTRLLR